MDRALLRYGLRNFVLMMLLVLFTAGCTTEDDEGDDLLEPASETATSVVEPTATAVSAATLEPLTEVNGQAISDGVCMAVIPDGWVDDGTGRGTFAGGGRFVLFGGSVTSDAAWQAALSIVATPTAGLTIASEERTEDAIFVTYANDRGFEYRERFGNRYCDLTVTSSNPIPPEARAIWPAILDTLAPIAP